MNYRLIKFGNFRFSVFITLYCHSKSLCCASDSIGKRMNHNSTHRLIVPPNVTWTNVIKVLLKYLKTENGEKENIPKENLKIHTMFIFLRNKHSVNINIFDRKHA